MGRWTVCQWRKCVVIIYVYGWWWEVGDVLSLSWHKQTCDLWPSRALSDRCRWPLIMISTKAAMLIMFWSMLPILWSRLLLFELHNSLLHNLCLWISFLFLHNPLYSELTCWCVHRAMKLEPKTFDPCLLHTLTSDLLLGLYTNQTSTTWRMTMTLTLMLHAVDCTRAVNVFYVYVYM